jgi:hypothetical protein
VPQEQETEDQSEPTEHNESTGSESSEPGSTSVGDPADPFDQVLRHAAESRAERMDDED